MISPAARLLVAGTGSGCGKTTAVCAILQALVDRGEDVAAFKCGPDYIDPMFAARITGEGSVNLDLFLGGEVATWRAFAMHARGLNLIEGVMGYYDGIDAASDECSSWRVARALDAPALLVADARGASLSVAAVARGFAAFREDSRVAGVLLNRVSPARYPALKRAVEAECGARVYGCLPPLPDAALPSRHLGLVMPGEVADVRARLARLAEAAEQSVDLDGLVDLMRRQAPLDVDVPEWEKVGEATIAVARDEAFCFYYRDNLELLEALGAKLVYFSPLRDAVLPPCDGLYLGGGYPELHAEALAANAGMRESVRAAVMGGLPTVAECGGFMYLTENIDGRPMAGALPGGCARREHLTRFGYATLRARGDSLLFAAGDVARCHEFHIWDADDPGDTLEAEKPSGARWRCAHVSQTLYAGFGHLYFLGAPQAARRFVRKCAERREHP